MFTCLMLFPSLGDGMGAYVTYQVTTKVIRTSGASDSTSCFF